MQEAVNLNSIDALLLAWKNTEFNARRGKKGNAGECLDFSSKIVVRYRFRSSCE